MHRLAGLLICTVFAGCAVAQSSAPGAFTACPVNPRATRLDAVALQCFTGTSIGAPKPSVVALLSPRMVLSLIEWPRQQREAMDLGFHVKVWLDPRVPEPEWLAALETLSQATLLAMSPELLPINCLAYWQPIDHVPLVRVLWGEQLHNWPIWGAMTTQAWEETLLNRWRSLRNPRLDCAAAPARFSAYRTTP